MGKIIDKVKQELERREWDFNGPLRADNGRLQITSGVKGKHGNYRIIFSTDEEMERLTILILPGVFCPAATRPATSVYLTRCNFGLILGNFELDMEDGEMRYKCSSDFKGGQVSLKMIENMMDAATIGMETFFGGYLAVCFGNKDPKAAYDEALGRQSSNDPTAVLESLMAALPTVDATPATPMVEELPGVLQQ